MGIPEGARDIHTAAEVDEVGAALAQVQEFSVDVEADQMHHFRASLCFVQVGTETDIFLLDTLKPGVSPKPLAGAFGDASKTKFFHAAGGDLQYLAEAGVRVQGLFDTHRAATLLGWPKVGLADLVRERLKVELKKDHQQSDFSERPLPPGMRDYIADDVRYLTEIGRQVREACRTADILEEVELDCARMCHDATRPFDPSTDFKPKLNRQGLSANQLKLVEAAAWELHRMRLKWAEAADVPIGRMLSNAAVTAIATKIPNDLRELSKREGVRGAFVREHGDETLEKMKELIQLSRDGKLPEVEKDEGPRDPKKKKREDALMAWRKEEAAKRKVTGSAVLSNPLVEELSSNPPASVEALKSIAFFGDKRVQLYGAKLVELLKAI